MYKLPIQNYYIRDKLDNHEEIKSQVLSLIDNSDDYGLKEVNENYNNTISKLDWLNNSDFDRPWVKMILPSLIKRLGEMAYSIGFHSIMMKVIWYQQYKKNSIHDWHVHSENYTGVYYLEYPEGSPATKLYGNDVITPDVNEGDVVMFPAMTPHQAPMVMNDNRKTIISYNFNVNELNLDKLKEVRHA